MILVSQLFILLVNDLLKGFDHLCGSFCHLLAFLFMHLVKLILLRHYRVIHHCILVQVPVSELPLAELFNGIVLLDYLFSSLVQLFPGPL